MFHLKLNPNILLNSNEVNSSSKSILLYFSSNSSKYPLIIQIVLLFLLKFCFTTKSNVESWLNVTKTYLLRINKYLTN